MMQILVQLQILKSGIHGGTGVALEMLSWVTGQDVGLHGDVVGEGFLAHGTQDPLAGEHLLDVGVVIGRPQAADGDVVSTGVLAPG